MARSVTYLIKAFAGASVDGEAIKLPDYGGPLRDDRFSVFVWSTALGGGSVTIEVSPDDGANWFVARRVEETQAIFAVNDVQTVFLKGTHVRARATGGGGFTGLNVGFA